MVLKSGEFMKKEEQKCPLSIVEWVNYLTLEQNRARYDYYNNEISFLTIMLLLMTVLNCLLVLFTVLFNFSFIDADRKNIIFMASFAALTGIIILIGYMVLRALPRLKKRMYGILNEEANIIEDILKGKEKDVQNISKRYFEIWDDKKNLR